MKFFVDVMYDSLYKHDEELCGDKVEIVRQPESFIMVLADGLGSGVKANILATLTSKIIATMLAGGASLDDAISTIASTLPVCRERNLAYSTFTVAHVSKEGEVFIAEFDNPLCVVFRDGVLLPLEREIADIDGKRVHICKFQAQTNDMLISFSDGVVHAGVGKLLDLGWMYENVVAFLESTVKNKPSIRKILRDVLISVQAFYMDSCGDDSTVCILHFKENVKATIMVGPPQLREHDAVVVKELMSSTGYKIVCGGTTSQIVANEINEDVIVNLDYDTPSLPPCAHIKGIDLVTEGVLTLGKAVQILAEMNQESGNLNMLDLNKRDGASRLAKLLCDECTDISFLVGRAINPAHQNPDMPISLNLKLQLVRECAQELEKRGKKVRITYY